MVKVGLVSFTGVFGFSDTQSDSPVSKAIKFNMEKSLEVSDKKLIRCTWMYNV